MLTQLEWKCLWSIADDYEEISQITLDLRNNAGTEVSPQDVSVGLQKLVSLDLANAYRYDESKQDYVTVDIDSTMALLPGVAVTWHPGESSASRVWFYITKLGLETLKGQASPWVAE